jgi:hypothetical protein
LGAEGGFIKDLNDIPVWIGAVERAATITMGARRLTEGNIPDGESLGSAVYIFRCLHDKPKMVKALSALGNVYRSPVQGKVITA